MLRRFKTLLCLGVALAYSYANVLSLYASETRFWSERREAAQRLRRSSQPSDDAGLSPSSMTPGQRELLAQLPSAGRMDFRATEPASG